MIPTDVQRAGPEAVKRYRRCLKRGGGERLAEMLALRAPHGINTSDTYLQRRRENLEEWEKKRIALGAKSHGLPEESVYDPTLADRPQDGAAFFDSADQHKRRSEEFHSRAADDDGSPKYKLHPQIVAEERARLIAQDPGLKDADQRELDERIIDEQAPNF